MTEVLDAAAQADRALKAKHRAMWALGDYVAIAHDIIAPLGPRIVDALDIQPGERVLDVAAGAGNAAIPAAQRGATVVASDLTPELLETGRQDAERAGVRVSFEEADAEALPYADASFDTVISVVGVMFAPHHQATADELLRVVRPDGRIGLISWTPEGFIGQMFATMKPYAPPPPPGAQPPPLWGSEAHVRELFGDRVVDVEARRQSLPVTAYANPEAFRDYFKRNYGPTIAVYRFIADDPEKVAALDRDLVDLAGRFGLTSESGATEWEYLLFTARRA
jgi:ubiquinone/menaquinone biosynthesis C-methylase UbiE